MNDGDMKTLRQATVQAWIDQVAFRRRQRNRETLLVVLMLLCTACMAYACR